MGISLRRRPVEWTGIAFAFALGMAPVSVGAASTECWGTWRFEVSRPTSDQEQVLSADSWCRGAKLPRMFTAEARPAPDGRGMLTGTPMRVVDIMKGGGRCEFQFAGPPAAGGRYFDLSIDVNATGAVAEGKARCGERTRDSKEESSGIVVELPVTGSHAAAPSAAPAVSGVDRQAVAVVGACRQRDADALWKAMTARLRSELDQRAAQVRQAAGSDLRRLFGYKGRPQDFDGLAYLRATVKKDDSTTNLCWHADAWKVAPAVATSAGYLVPLERGDVTAGLTFTKRGGGWQLDQISKWVQVPKR